ncbi:MAG: hypothetical protein ACP5N7_06345 [Candidatus Pacearchaeota archaeon]
MNRKGTIGQILTSFPSIIFLLLIILAYILVSSFIVMDNIESYSLMDDFLDDYVVYDGSILTVNELLTNYCNDNSIGPTLRPTLSEHFLEKYGAGNTFVLTYAIDDGVVKVVDWAGYVEPYVGSDGAISDYVNYNSLVDYSDKKSVRRICNRIDFYAKEGQ